MIQIGRAYVFAGGIKIRAFDHSKSVTIIFDECNAIDGDDIPELIDILKIEYDKCNFPKAIVKGVK